MAAGTRATRSQSKTTPVKPSMKKPKPVKKTTKKAQSEPEFDVQDGNGATSAYFAKEHDGDSLDEGSDAPVMKKRPTSTRSAKKSQPVTKRRKVSADDSDFEEAQSDGEEAEEAAKNRKMYDSDALDEESEYDIVKGTKRGKKASPAKKKPASPRKKKTQPAADVDDESVDDEDLKEGQEIVGIVVQAPKTGRVPPGQISQNTLDFLTELKDPACNDREWFKLHEPVYRVAEKEWKDFVEAFTDVLAEVDPQIAHLPPKDLIHRIYRDVRFSNDKTPYKKGLSASFSRSGRKGIFAGYHIAVKPDNESIIAAGSWCPARNELATIRSNIQRNSRRLREVISAPEFVKFFGEPTPHPKGSRQNIFGMDDELKVAPKGVAKDDKDIDLLKCRSFAVVHHFTDSEVVAPDFKETIAIVARVMLPFVHCLNDMMTIMPDDESEDDEDGQD